MKILIAVDDSAYSQAAMDWAKRMEWPARTEFIVFSAAQPILAAYAFAGVAPAPYSGELYEAEMKQHEEIAARFEGQLRDHGFKSKAVVRQGDPREAIVETAREHGADLIVVGSHGRSGISKLVLGSVANHVVTHAPCSVLVVKLAPEAAQPARERVRS